MRPDAVSEAKGETGWILAIETSHTPGSVCTGPGSGPATPTEEVFPPGLVHAREILPAIDRVCAAAGVERGDLGLVAVSMGPGSYTGVRVGVSATKALAFALGIPSLGLSSLEVIAGNSTVTGEFAVILDARRGAAYSARFCRDEGGVTRLDADRIVPVAELLAELPEDVPLVGSGAGTLPGTEHRPRLDETWNTPRAAVVYELARERWRAIREGLSTAPEEYSDPRTLVPRYLRASEAEEQRARREREA